MTPGLASPTDVCQGVPDSGRVSLGRVETMVKKHREAPEIGAACARMMRALARRAGDGELEALEQLARLQVDLQHQLGAAVAGYRAFQPAHGAAPYSWADVGRILGVTRQSAYERFHRYERTTR